MAGRASGSRKKASSLAAGRSCSATKVGSMRYATSGACRAKIMNEKALSHANQGRAMHQRTMASPPYQQAIRPPMTVPLWRSVING